MLSSMDVFGDLFGDVVGEVMFVIQNLEDCRLICLSLRARYV